jgi:hypothetical protein
MYPPIGIELLIERSLRGARVGDPVHPRPRPRRRIFRRS